MIFSMNDVKPENTHLASPFELSSGLCLINKEEKYYMYWVSYACVVGSFKYVIIYTRSYISHVVGVVSRYMENLGWETMKSVFW